MRDIWLNLEVGYNKHFLWTIVLEMFLIMSPSDDNLSSLSIFLNLHIFKMATKVNVTDIVVLTYIA